MNYEGTIVIGDVHGLTNWQDIVNSHPNHRIVFLGDYCDPYECMEDEDVVDNLWNIISCKKLYPERIVLLLGNHDMHYLFDEEHFRCGSRFNPDLEERLHDMFELNRDLFVYAYQDGERLYTHAGMGAIWFRDVFGWEKAVTRDSLPEIARALNHPTKKQFKAMCMVGRARGGNHVYPGIFWADITEVSMPVRGIHQVVGHNQVDRPRTLKTYDDTSITFCDCLRFDEFLELKNPKKV